VLNENSYNYSNTDNNVSGMRPMKTHQLESLHNDQLSIQDMKDLWVLVELSPIDIKHLVWYVMRRSGMRYSDIGNAFGVTKQRVHEAIKQFEKKIK
jgi:DNA-binding MarR family transcriptional regulator